jgi:hypothetical protein
MSIPKEGRHKYRYVGAYLYLWFANEFSSLIGVDLFHVEMNLLINIVEFFFVLFIVMMYKDLIHVKRISMIAYIAIGLHWIFGLINICFIQGPFNSNSYTWALSNIIIVSSGLYYFYFLIKNIPLQVTLTRIPMFWINLAVLITHVGTFFVYIFEDYLVNSLNSNFIIPFFFHVSFAIIFQPIAWYALLMIRSDYRNRATSLQHEN